MGVLIGRGDAERGAPGDRPVADVADLLTGGRLSSDDAAFCSNNPIKDVVGGISRVSNGWSMLSLEELPPLLTDGDLVPWPEGLPH